MMSPNICDPICDPISDTQAEAWLVVSSGAMRALIVKEFRELVRDRCGLTGGVVGR